ncbi:MAG: acetolactate synthase, large subunit, biosynthetic type [Vampirovibrio sp.]|jgi:acetolactate synthase-1/2/3 large subunit|nr:acetolactate synthase, large subunit, biosynthetic type [Vampirovibrio sp.]
MAARSELHCPPASHPIQPVSQTCTGAEILLNCLIAEGVDTMFGMPGGVLLSFYEALPNFPINHILVRHEQGAVHMAEGYARATGKPGVAMATSGPGATNLVTGLADAYYDSIPIVALTGNVPSSLLGNDAFQEADIVGITRPITKHNIIVRRVEDLAQAVKEAFHVATTGRPGPVLVDIPKDILLASTEFNYAQTTIDLPGYHNPQTYTMQDIDAILALLKEAKQPVLLSGGGVINAGAHDEVRTFAERFNIPTSCSLMGLGGFPTSHPLYMGFCGMHGQYWANIAIANADLLLVVGNRLGDRQTGKTDRFARNAKIVHIDLDPSSLQKNVETFLPVQGEIKEIFQHLLAQTEDMAPFAESLTSRSQWFQTIDGWKTRRKPEIFPDGFLSPQFVIERLFHWMPKDGFVTTEVGQHQMWAAQRFNLDRPRSFISSGGLGTMGFGFPAALGVQAAFPDKTVLDIAGDGSFQMTLQELATARDHGLAVKIAVINNGYLGMVRQWQDKTWNRPSQSRMTSPDYIKLAEAYGGVGFVVNHPDEVDAVIQQAYAITDRPVIIDFRVKEKADVYPWVPAGAANEEMLTEDSATNEHKN